MSASATQGGHNNTEQTYLTTDVAGKFNIFSMYKPTWYSKIDRPVYE